MFIIIQYETHVDTAFMITFMFCFYTKFKTFVSINTATLLVYVE